MKILIFADVHGNLEAYESVISSVQAKGIGGCVILGDLVDYGMHSNEVIEQIADLDIPIICNIWGNHEYSIINGDYSRFSSERGVLSAKYIQSSLRADTIDYIKSSMRQSGFLKFSVDGRKCLAIHGSLADVYWESITPDTAVQDYADFDYVFSGHSHVPHFFEKFVSVDNPEMRNKKKVVFVNPGSVGQPRNHNNLAQYVIFDTETENVEMIKQEYDIKKEQSAYKGEVDDFYKLRLERGI